MASIKKVEKAIDEHNAKRGKSLNDVLIYIPEQLKALDVMLEKELGLVGGGSGAVTDGGTEN